MGYFGIKDQQYRRRIRVPVDANSAAVPNEGDALMWKSAGYVGTIEGAVPGQICGIAAESLGSVGSVDGDKNIDMFVDERADFEYKAATPANLASTRILSLVDMTAVQTVDEDAASSANNQVLLKSYDSVAGTVVVNILFSKAYRNQT